MDVRISIDPQTHLKEEWGHDVTLIEDDIPLVGVPVHKTSPWSSQIAILSPIPSWIWYQRLMTNLLNSALSPAVLPARCPTTVANVFCSYIALNAVNNVKTDLEVGERVVHAMYTSTSPLTQRYTHQTALETCPNLSSAPCRICRYQMVYQILRFWNLHLHHCGCDTIGNFFWRLSHLTWPGDLSWGDLESNFSLNVRKRCQNGFF